MSDRTPAQRLTAAADRLDALLAQATPGPWWADGTEIYGDATLPINWIGETCTQDDLAGGEANGAYIAAMDPTVGRALADLLRLYATAGPASSPTILAIADAILGGDHD